MEGFLYPQSCSTSERGKKNIKAIQETIGGNLATVSSEMTVEQNNSRNVIIMVC